MSEIRREDLIQISEYVYEIPTSYRSDMRVPARVFAHETLLDDILQDRALQQLVNVTTLPGIQKYAYAMPDIHQGYGFPIGGVAATAIDEGGVISPGGIGYDINCGVRLLATSLTAAQLHPYREELATALFTAVPSGVGRAGKLEFSTREIDGILQNGAQYLLERGIGQQSDITFCEEEGRMQIARPELVSAVAKKRGADQLGTLGSGNHFLEVQRVDEIFDSAAAQVLGLAQDQVLVMIHCGSRGLGHQTCTDYVRTFVSHSREWNIVLPDRELVCAPFVSTQGQEYFAAMAACANFAWANRHMITQQVRDAFAQVIGASVSVRTVYDISHNMGKLETHDIAGRSRPLLVHRKGATRAFGPGCAQIPQAYREIGQPVLIPGTMGTSSYVLVGAAKSMHVSFGTSCHGAGRRWSRMHAKREMRGATVRQELESQGIVVKCNSQAGLAEEAPRAYKDVERVVDVVHNAHMAYKVARLKPLIVIKGE